MEASEPSHHRAPHRLQQLAALSQRLAEDTLDLTAVLHTAVEQLCVFLGDGCMITLLEEQILRPVARFHSNPDALALSDAIQAQTVIRVGEGLVGGVAASGQPLFLSNLSFEDSRSRINPHFAAYLERFPSHSYMILPLRCRGVILGTLGMIRDATPNPYTAEDFLFVEEVADRVALTIANARLYQQLLSANQSLAQEVATHLGANRQLAEQLGEQQRLEHVLRDAMQAAEEANQAKGAFLSRMSHELRTPLNAILGFAQLLQLDLTDPIHKENVGHILQSGRHLLALIAELLDVARIDAGHLHLELEALPLLPVVLDTVAIMMPLALARAVSIQVAVEGLAPWTVRADEQRLKQVLLNLLANAVTYNQSGGTIQIRGAARKSCLVLEIADTGLGIPAERLSDLFTPFARLGAERSGVPGTGLGLAITKRLIEAMGGTIAISSQTGDGTTVTLTLPLATPGPAGAPEPQSQPASEAGAALPPATVALIEDTASNARLLEQLFSGMPAITLRTAPTGRDGLALVRGEQPALVLLDLHLPDMDGATIVQQLQADPATRHIPVVILSADAAPGQRERLLALGAWAYLTKPIDTSRLIETLAAALAPGAAPPDPEPPC